MFKITYVDTAGDELEVGAESVSWCEDRVEGYGSTEWNISNLVCIIPIVRVVSIVKAE
jgi:hypothetical protein